MQHAPRQFAQIALLVAGAAAAMLLAGLCIGVNLERACTTRDTPYLDLCPGQPTAGAAADSLRARIAANPGDAPAYVQLALADRSDAGKRLVRAAARLWPGEPNLLALLAALSLESGAWAEAMAPLVQLVEYRDTAQAARVLARLIAGGQGDLLLPFVKADSRWLGRTLAQMHPAQASFAPALPLVAQGLKLGALEPEAVRVYIAQLKSAGAWADAYSLWLALHGGKLPVLYNASFDTPFQPDGFDWEVPGRGPPGRAGAIVERRGAQARGATLEVRFTGREFTLPLARQPLFLGEGRYRLRGEFSGQQLRMENGLAWTVRCTATRAPAGRSRALSDTASAWQVFDFEFTVPAGCGLVANLELETFAPFEAALGARGRIAFDALSLEKLPP